MFLGEGIGFSRDQPRLFSPVSMAFFTSSDHHNRFIDIRL